MPVMLERWNDDKMDALDAKVERVEGELLEQRREIKAGFERLGERLDRMQRTMLWAAVTIIVALLGSSSAIITALINSSHP
jgi:hypothetical protein